MNVGVRHWAAAVGLAGLSLLTGCGNFFVYPGSTGSGAGSTSGDYVYVANGITNTIAGFAVGTGALTAVSNSPYALTISPTAVAVNPGNTILYVGSNAFLYAYAISSTGALTLLNNGYAVANANVIAMDISPDGQWLFALDGNGFSVDEFQINNTTGVLTQQAGAAYSITTATVVPRAIKVAPNGSFVFAALGTAGDLVFTLNEATGVITASQQLATGSSTTSDNGLAVSPSSNYLYIARSGTSGGLAVYSVTSGTGALTAISGSPFSAGTQPYSVAVNQAGTAVYVANRGDSTISGYTISSTGALTTISGSPFTSGNAVTALIADRSGSFLAAASTGGSPDLALYSFDTTTTGKLDLSTSTTTGTDPTGAIAIAATH
jgi:6-phosphogluconolactonase